MGLLALVFGIVGLFEKERKRAAAIVGTVFSGVIAVCIFLVLVLAAIGLSS